MSWKLPIVGYSACYVHFCHVQLSGLCSGAHDVCLYYLIDRAKTTQTYASFS